MLDLVCKSQRGNVLSETKKRISLFSELSLPSARWHRFSCTNEIQASRAGCSPGTITPRNSERTGLCGSTPVGAEQLCRPVAPLSSAVMKRRDHRRDVRGRGHSKVSQQVAPFATSVMEWFCFQALHVCALMCCIGGKGVARAECLAAPRASLLAWC